MTPTKVVIFNDIYNFPFHAFLIWIRWGPKDSYRNPVKKIWEECFCRLVTSDFAIKWLEEVLTSFEVESSSLHVSVLHEKSRDLWLATHNSQPLELEKNAFLARVMTSKEWFLETYI